MKGANRPLTVQKNGLTIDRYGYLARKERKALISFLKEVAKTKGMVVHLPSSDGYSDRIEIHAGSVRQDLQWMTFDYEQSWGDAPNFPTEDQIFIAVIAALSTFPDAVPLAVVRQ